MAITRLNNNSISSVTALPSGVGGVTMSNMWRITTSLAISAATDTFIVSNWEQVDTNGYANIGSAMTESSGVFTFPETGIYLINFGIQIHSPSQGATYAGGRIFTTTDNGTYTQGSEQFGSIYHSNGYGVAYPSNVFDVTNVSTHKIKLQALCEFASDVIGSTSYNATWVRFMKLGNT
jgi:hypothetical protein